MKRRNNYLAKLAAIFLALLMSAGASLAAPPLKNENLKKENPQSVFIIPTNPREGRDPFFPNSDRLEREYSLANTHSNAPSASDLTVKAILTAPDGHAFAIINNHTFAPGDDGDVLSKDGSGRIHVYCVAIDPKTNTVTVKCGGTTVALIFSGVH